MVCRTWMPTWKNGRKRKHQQFLTSESCLYFSAGTGRKRVVPGLLDRRNQIAGPRISDIGRHIFGDSARFNDWRRRSDDAGSRWQFLGDSAKSRWRESDFL